MAHQQICKKSTMKRDYTFVKNNHKNRKYIKAINCSNNEVSYYNSLYAVQKHLQINSGLVKMVCEGLNHCKSGNSKKDGFSYKFEYINKDDLPSNYLTSSKTGLKRRQLLTDEEKKKNKRESIKKWQKKDYVCSKCNKTYKNNYKYIHSKICK